MILRTGLAATHLVTFATGHPDGDVTWQVLDSDGLEIDAGSVTPAAGAVSVLLPVSPEVTELPVGSLQKVIDLVWSYTSNGAAVNGEARYTVEARLELGISADGVRRKLGVTRSELPDSEISLVSAYLVFVDTVTEARFLAARGLSPLTDMRARDAVEAMAALALIPTMPVRIARSESSGTNEFSRQNVDWTGIADELMALIDHGLSAVDPTYDPTATNGSLLLLATPATDPFTGTTG